MRIWQTKVPRFHSKNSAKFRVWYAMAHRQGFVPVYMACVSMCVLRRAEAHQSNKHVNACRIHQSNKHVNVCHIHGESKVT